ncbi:MAG: hypothetical protein V4612_02640 [Pseudomonadota bacterium]
MRERRTKYAYTLEDMMGALGDPLVTDLELGFQLGSKTDEEIAPALELLATNTTLISLTATGRCDLKTIKKIAEALETNTKLSSLSLDTNRFGDEGAMAIASLLTKNKALTNLDLSGNRIGVEGAKAIATALTKNTTLTSLGLNNNMLGGDGVREISTALATNTTLTSLALGFNRMGYEGTMDASLLIKNTLLINLNFSDNTVSYEGVKEIATALATNTTLKSLNLNGNMFGDLEVEEIARALQTNATLTSLELLGNIFGNTGVTAIAKALETNTTITDLDCSLNRIGTEGAMAIAAVLETNTPLTNLNLFQNNIGAEGATQIITALLTNQTLTKLNLGNNNILFQELELETARAMAETEVVLREELANIIATVLEENKTLVTLDFSGTRFIEEEPAATAIASTLMTPECKIEKIYCRNPQYQEAFDGAIEIRHRKEEVHLLTMEFASTEKTPREKASGEETLEVEDDKKYENHPLKKLPQDLLRVVHDISIDAHLKSPNPIIQSAFAKQAQERLDKQGPKIT